ncbi:MAG: S-adenosylmethionine decarboxylase [Chloroflexi bacterium]|nr:MAG: S-adenosylmethionine decarboxylase [Chloroflexota bacterium]
MIIDGYKADFKKLSDKTVVYDFLNMLPEEIKMTKLIEPQVYLYKGNKKEDWGVSGFVLIAESHISVHTFPDREYINIDIFSCKKFDSYKSEKQAKDFFNIGKIKSVTLERGIDFDDPQELKEDMESSRVNLTAQTIKFLGVDEESSRETHD